VPGTGSSDGSTSGDTGGGDTGVDTGATNPPADSTPDTEAPAGVACTYTIVGGDTPSQVASNRGVSLDELQAANPSMDFSTTFVVGDTINIPEPGTC
jgi:LysM repeat protein